MKRRTFITLLGGAAPWPLAARAQQPAIPVVGFLNGGSAWEYGPQATAFRRGLSETGYVEGRNVALEYRWAEGHYERLPDLAADLVRRQVAVIAGANLTAAVAAKAATATIPIVFVTASDPVALGLVASLSRPSGNLTGVANLGVELGPKQLELLRELIPRATIIAGLVNPTAANAKAISRDLQAAARRLGLQLHLLHASTERDFDKVFATLVQLQAGGLVIGPNAFFASRIELLAALALQHAVPTIARYREFATAGGLMSYGSSSIDLFRLVGIYTGRILKGERAADLPVQQAVKFELAVNLKTAGALGLTVPPTLRAIADEIIE